MRTPISVGFLDREEWRRSAEQGDECRVAEALFGSWVVEMGAWDGCEAVARWNRLRGLSGDIVQL